MESVEARQAGVSVPQPLQVEVARPGDPLIIGLASFVIGATALGLNLVDYVTAGGSVLPIVMAASGLGLFVAMLWAARLGQTFVAGVTGIFSSFWFSYAILLLGLSHNWFAIPAEDIAGSIRLFLLSWVILVFLLTVASLRLPVAYSLLIGLVDLALIIVFFAWVADPPPSTGLLKLGGYVVFLAGAVGAYLFLHSGSVSLGGRGYKLGSPVVK